MTEYTSTISDTINDDISDSDDNSDGIDTNTCCICLEEVPDDSSYKLEQCGHLFHTDCIVRNIQQGNISCPCCRKLPLFISNVNHSYDLREDLIDEYNEDLDDYFVNQVGYKKLRSYINGLFYSPYAATSVREYFARGFEAYFLFKDQKYLASLVFSIPSEPYSNPSPRPRP